MSATLPTRLDQLGFLFTAMMAVIVTGRMPEGFGIAAQEAVPSPSTLSDVPPAPAIDIKSFFAKRTEAYGVISAVAKRFGVSPSHVAQVARGIRKSGRITEDLSREMEERGFDAGLESIFTQNNIAHGAIAAVADRLHLSPNHVAQVARGLRKSARVTNELHREMTNRGFETATSGGAL